ncbi:unnamed protein product [Choristocarpus tenellus]
MASKLLPMVSPTGQRETFKTNGDDEGHLGASEMARRKALEGAHGEGMKMSWVESVLLGVGKEEDLEPEAHLQTPARGISSTPAEPLPPGMEPVQERPSAELIARRELDLKQQLQILLRCSDSADSLSSLLTKASAEGVDLPRWLGTPVFPKGRTALMEAALRDRPRCVATLVGASARVNDQNHQNGDYTAIHYGAYYGAAGAALELLVHGADPHIRNKHGETALQSACQASRHECADVVRDFLRRPVFATEDRSSWCRSRTGKNNSKGPGGCASEHKNAGVAEVAQANVVYCLGRKRRRMGAGCAMGRCGLGVGVGTVWADIRLALWRGLRLHSINPFAGTAAEQYIFQSIASGQDPFSGEGGPARTGMRGVGVSDEVKDGDMGNVTDLWLEHYVRVYNASIWAWHLKENPPEGEMDVNLEKSAGVKAGKNSDDGEVATGMMKDVGEGLGADFVLVVQESKSLAPGRRFELPCGSEIVVGRSHHLSQLVIKDDKVSKAHLRLTVSPDLGLRATDLCSKHGSIIQKPDPNSTTPSTTLENSEAMAGLGVEKGLDTGRTPEASCKVFPIPIPREPEWVTGADGDRIKVGQTVLRIERVMVERRAVTPGGRSEVVETSAAGAGISSRPRTKMVKPSVISKGFRMNPNLFDAIRLSREVASIMHKKRGLTAAEHDGDKRRVTVLSHHSGDALSTILPANPFHPLPALNLCAVLCSAALSGSARLHPQCPCLWAHQLQEKGEGGGRRPPNFDHILRGNVLLKRLGWKEGEGLGRTSTGRLEPVEVERRVDREGLGAAPAGPYALGSDGRISKWERMRQRFNREEGFHGSSLSWRGQGGKDWQKGGVEGGQGH